jgi:hypothetical protein
VDNKRSVRVRLRVSAVNYLLLPFSLCAVFLSPSRPTSRLARLAGHSVPLLRNIRQSGYLTFVIPQGVFFLILVH